jgi:hypothetical protein
VADPVSTSDKQSRNANDCLRPEGLEPENGAYGVAAIRNPTSSACLRRLAQENKIWPSSEDNAGTENFEIAVYIYRKNRSESGPVGPSPELIAIMDNVEHIYPAYY